jgi:lysophospholipase L1-like esterase
MARRAACTTPSPGRMPPRRHGAPRSRRTRAVALLLGLLLVSTCAPQPEARPGVDIAARLGPYAPLLPLFRALSLQEAHKATAPLVIVQIGDSHTANDSFSGRMREQFQEQFGDGGRGILPPGIPYRYYRPARVSVVSQGWSVESSFSAGASGPFGVTGLRQHTDRPASMTLSAPEPGDLARIEIEVLRQPGGGTIGIDIDGAPSNASSMVIGTNAPAVQSAWVPVPSTALTHTLTLRARGDGPVDVLAWDVRRGTPGVIYANLGTIGASVDIMDRWDPVILRHDLAHLAPALIVLAFGTNEGFRDSTDPEAYAVAFRSRLHELHAAAPGAAILVLGPPDGVRHRRRGSPEPAACGDPNWTEPPRLAAVRQAERAAALREHAYFWDWREAMGGRCSMLRWAAADPPFAAPDHVHLFAPGYQATAEALFRTIMAGYTEYRALRPSS